MPEDQSEISNKIAEINKKPISRRDFLKGMGKLAGAAAVKPLFPFIETPGEQPPEKPGKSSQKGGFSTGNKNKSESPQSIPDEQTATPAPEAKGLETITVSASIEKDPDDQEVENISFRLPENVLQGETPLIPEGKGLLMAFNLDSTLPIKEITVSTDHLFGTKTGSAELQGDATLPSVFIGGSEIIGSMLDSATSEGDKLNFPPSSQDIINAMEITFGQLEDGITLVRLVLPNNSVQYDNENGSHLVNPAERFASGEMKIGIKRWGDLQEGAVIRNADIFARDVYIGNSEGQKVATIEDIQIQPHSNQTEALDQETITVRSEDTTVTERVTTPGDQSVSLSPEQMEEIQSLKEKWVDRQWKENEQVSLAEWWIDMTNQGYIEIDSLAEQYAGDEINRLVNGSHMIPNPNEAWNNELPFIGNCDSSLNQLVHLGQGHITISQDAYKLIPGGSECQIFSNN
ncbi:hypothetical protein JXA63_01185 [Candidatus Woesebacteria bacterium]|nr:hypothetical protein [Candidatus Woesebacteria bacterium]